MSSGKAHAVDDDGTIPYARMTALEAMCILEQYAGEECMRRIKEYVTWNPGSDRSKRIWGTMGGRWNPQTVMWALSGMWVSNFSDEQKKEASALIYGSVPDRWMEVEEWRLSHV